MSDELLRMLAGKAGIATQWTDQVGVNKEVSVETLRAVLTALSLPCGTPGDIHNSLLAIESGADRATGVPFVTARADQPAVLPIAAPAGTPVEITFENGAVRVVSSISGIEGIVTMPPLGDPGYHTVRVADQEFTVATAPSRSITVDDMTGGQKAWGLSAQIYSLRREGDCGIGDFGGVAAVARKSAAMGADVLAVSPVHALYAASPGHYSPYSPSSRLFYNPLYADSKLIVPDELVRSIVEEQGLGEEMARLESLALVDWTAASPIKYRILRGIYDKMRSGAEGMEALAFEFDRFREQSPALLNSHATFEAIREKQLAINPSVWNWRGWSKEFLHPDNPEVTQFAEEHAPEIAFHIFLQWIAGRSYSETQRICRDNGMRIGLIADLAIGMDGAGSHAWSRQDDILTGLSVGAPPDFYNSAGQNWGLTTFSPRGLRATAFSPFIETLRATLRHVGGIRIDHIMGMARLWLVPDGAGATEGAYLDYPSETFFRLIALESWRHKAIVIGEDLGTLPDGFRENLQDQGISGMRVLRFERKLDHFKRAQDWAGSAVAMTTTHDLISTAGWWAGADLEPEAQGAADETNPHAIRAWDSGLLWGAFQNEGLVHGERPAPDNTGPVVDAAVKFIAKTPCRLKILALEDALGVEDQPNVPGTIDEKPNWRHRLAGPAEDLLKDQAVASRLAILDEASD